MGSNEYKISSECRRPRYPPDVDLWFTQQLQVYVPSSLSGRSVNYAPFKFICRFGMLSVRTNFSLVRVRIKIKVYRNKIYVKPQLLYYNAAHAIENAIRKSNAKIRLEIFW